MGRPCTDVGTAVLECEVLVKVTWEQKRLLSCPVLVGVAVDPGIGQ